LLELFTIATTSAVID